MGRKKTVTTEYERGRCIAGETAYDCRNDKDMREHLASYKRVAGLCAASKIKTDIEQAFHRGFFDELNERGF